MSERESLFSARFFVMCGFTFSVFFSALALFPTAPFHIQELGGSTFAAGLFLGLLTYASAFSAPLTGALGDRVGKRPVMLVASLAVVGITVGYASVTSYPVLLGLAFIHGIFWSSLLSNSSAYLVDILPESRRAEGLAYWGLATVLALALAPPAGFWLYERSWAWVCGLGVVLNLITAVIAFLLPAEATHRAPDVRPEPVSLSTVIEWRVLLIAVSLFLCTFGYGGVASFSSVYADVQGIEPKSIYLTTLALIVLVTRPFVGRLADRVGYAQVLVPTFGFVAIGLGLLAFAETRTLFVISALIFGLGFGTAYPVFTAYIFQHVPPDRRGAAFGSVITAFDIGIGTGSTTIGWLIQHFGFFSAFGLGALVSGFALPYFWLLDWRMFRHASPSDRPTP